MKKDVLFTVYMYGSAQVEDVSEIHKIGCRVTFDKENVAIGTIQVEINSVAEIDEDGNVGKHSSLITPKLN
ncbi:MAG: hypothetical protein HYX79_02280 [Chloroflexi bacterium]|nr:hypothetical protein [Chloroflexota bacterium]